jgi:hypothetical protein
MEKNRDTRRIEREAGQAKSKDMAAIGGMKEAIKEAMKDSGTHKNIANELLTARRGGSAIKNRESFGDDGEVITGNPEDSPWLRD